MNSPKQTRVLEIIRENGGTATFQDFVNDPVVSDQHFNESYYVGQILARMVNAGTITRIKKGVYSSKRKINNHNQLTLL
jgi:hypothetical protein